MGGGIDSARGGKKAPALSPCHQIWSQRGGNGGHVLLVDDQLDQPVLVVHGSVELLHLEEDGVGRDGWVGMGWGVMGWGGIELRLW